MQLTAGVKIRIDQSLQTEDCVFINDGVEKAFGFDCYNHMQYMENSFKPKHTWRRLNERETELLTRLEPFNNLSDTIALIKIPDNIAHLVKEIGIDLVQDDHEIKAHIQQHAEKSQLLTARINQFCEGLLLPGQNMIYHAFGAQRPNIETTAFSTRTRKYFGLHLDRGEGSNMHNTALSANRICLNLGREKRSLLLVNKSVKQLKEMVLAADNSIDLNAISVDDLVIAFFSLYPDYPVIKIDQQPFEAYIAPTDNVIHDGTTLGNTSPDISLVLRGFFNPIPA